VRKRYLVDVYLALNLGDDLLLEHLVRIIPNADFVPFHPGTNYSFLIDNYPNLYPFEYNLIDKFKRRLGVDKLKDYDALSKEYDGLIFLGGGIFREESYWLEVYDYRLKISNQFKDKNKPVFFIGCNFGPFQNENFLKAYIDLFREVDRVNFRDLSSHKLFKHLENVNHYPDLIWGYPVEKSENNRQILGISLIHPKHKNGYEMYEQNYITHISEMAMKYQNKGYQIYLFSFCEKEGDLKMAECINRKVGNCEIKNYTGNIKSYLSEFSSCTKLIASRFHAIILGLKFEIPTLPISYGAKTDYLLKDINYPHKPLKLDNISSMDKYSFYVLEKDLLISLAIQSDEHFSMIS